MAEPSNPSAVWRAEIKGGPNAGAVLQLGHGRHAFGSHHDNDVVLADPHVVERHLILEVEDNGAVLTALSPGVRLDGSPLPAGKARHLSRRATLSLGDTLLDLSGPGRGARHWLRGRTLLSWAVPAATCATMLVMLPFHLGAAPALPGTKASSPPMEAPARRPLPAISAAVAADALRDRLRGAGLDGVELSAHDETIVAAGPLPPTDRDKWLAAQVWFDQSFHGRLALVDRTAAAKAETAPQLDIRAVSAGAVPFIITGSGDRYAEGATLPGGWFVVRITGEKVTVRNGSRSLDVVL